jgi:phosphoribosylanthranilate isomerase
VTAVDGAAVDEVFVKICGVTTEADALLAVGMGASAVGFVFAPSPRQMAPSVVADIVKRLPYETMTVGVFRDEARSRVVEIANQIGLRAVQLHGVESVEDTRWIAERVGLTIKAFPAGHPRINRFAEHGAQLLMIDGPSPGSGELFDWRLAEGVVDPRRLIVSGGLRPDNVGAAIAHLHPWGVDVCSGVEASPGVKDPGRLRDFITAAHAAARAVALAEEDGVTAPGTGVSGVATPGAAVDPTDGGDGLAGARSSGPTPDLFDWQSEQ